LIGLDEVRDWSRDEKGNVRHKSGQFFGIEGVRIESGNLREVASWDQPIYTQPEGGILGLIAREREGRGVEFLLYAKAEPGNLACCNSVPPFKAPGRTSAAPMAENRRRCWRC
jgi:dTDP-4-dehydro-6-deoxy-alpha-D-glucopyranose 2,3-dehydratase